MYSVRYPETWIQVKNMKPSFLVSACVFMLSLLDDGSCFPASFWALLVSLQRVRPADAPFMATDPTERKTCASRTTSPQMEVRSFNSVLTSWEDVNSYAVADIKSAPICKCLSRLELQQLFKCLINYSAETPSIINFSSSSSSQSKKFSCGIYQNPNQNRFICQEP